MHNVKIVNLTPHTVVLYAMDRITVVAEYPPAPEAARVVETPSELREPDALLPVPTRLPPTYGEVRGLPPRVPELTRDEGVSGPFGPPDVLYIVSLPVFQHLQRLRPLRDDILAVSWGADVVRYEDGPHRGQPRGTTAFLRLL